MDVLGIVLTVLTASLLGSLHCAVMCGPIFMSMTSGRATAASYHIGRLLSYLSLGGVAGALGSIAFGKFLASQTGLVTTLLASAYFAAAGFHLLTSQGPRKSGFFSKQLHGIVNRGSRWLSRVQSPKLRAFGVGLITAFLPCGWLYLFVGTALVMGRVAYALALLLAFWLGTLPVFTVLGELKSLLIGQQRRLGNIAAGCLLILLAVFLPLLKLTPLAHRIGGSLTEAQTFEIDELSQGQAALILPEGACRAVN